MIDENNIDIKKKIMYSTAKSVLSEYNFSENEIQEMKKAIKKFEEDTMRIMGLKIVYVTHKELKELKANS